MTNIDALLADRQKTHGEFSDHALAAQQLKDIVRAAPGYAKMNPAMREGVEMVLHKVARLCAGDPYAADHWLDIEGYAHLVHQRVANAANMIEDDVKSLARRLSPEIVVRTPISVSIPESAST